MEQFEQTVRDLAAKGFHTKCYFNGNGGHWHVELTCAVDILPANIPRPIGNGLTVVQALEAAIKNGHDDAQRYKIKDKL
jgi:hypothetical protein